MRKLIAFFILIILGIALYVYTGNLFSNTENSTSENSKISDTNKILDEIMEDYDSVIEEINNLQNTPDQVIKLNNMIIRKLYSGLVPDEEIELLLKAQREIYSKALLEKNPLDIHIQRGKDEVDKYKNTKVKIIGYDSLAPEYIGNEKDYTIIKVVFYLNQGEIYEEYLLEEADNEKWYIKGWQETEEFTVIGD